MTDENIKQFGSGEIRADSRAGFERHFQSALLGLISVLLAGTLWVLTEVLDSIDSVESRQSMQGQTISALVENQGNARERLDLLASDRYTATQAAQDKLEIRQNLSTISSRLADYGERIRRLENEWARFEGEREGSAQ